MEDKYDTWCLRAWRRRRTVSDWQARSQASRAALSIPESRLSARANASAAGPSRCPILPPICLSFLLKVLGTGTPGPQAPSLPSSPSHDLHALHITNGYYQRSCSTRQYRFIINIDSQSFSSLFRFGRFGARQRGSGPGSAKIKLKRRCFIFPCSTLLLRRR